jgi:hypothetical protein
MPIGFLLIHLSAFPALAAAHQGCCGDLPESLIWSLSLFLLVGCAILSLPTAPVAREDSAQTILIKIDPRDLKDCLAIINHPRCHV